MTVLTWNQIYALARSVGCTNTQAITATAITAPESGRDPNNHTGNPTDGGGTGDDSYGLWQINLYRSLGPPRRKEFDLAHDTDLLDPAINARAMWSISNHGTNFAPWSSYNAGKHKPYLPYAQTAADTVGDKWAAYLPGATPAPTPDPPKGTTMGKSQNGWPASPDLDTRVIKPVPGVSLRIVDNPNVAAIFTYLVQQFDKRVEPVAKGADDWGFAYRANVNSPNELSNHASGTALDLNAEKHPNAVATSRTYTTAQIATVHAILKELGGVVRWGGDYQHTVDAMHFEINEVPGTPLIGQIANKVAGAVTSGGTTPAPAGKSVTDLAHEVIEGDWGNGDDRKQRLGAAGYNAAAVQAEVNRLLR